MFDREELTRRATEAGRGAASPDPSGFQTAKKDCQTVRPVLQRGSRKTQTARGKTQIKPLMANRDYIPARDDDFNVWLTNFNAVLAPDYAAYGVTLEERNAIGGYTAQWQAAYAAATNGSTRSPATIAAKDAIRAQATAFVRPIAVRIILNPSVSNAQRETVGVTVRAGTRTPTPPPTTAPQLNIVSAIPLQVTLQYRDETTPDSKSKPPGVRACQVFASIGTVASIDPAQASWRIEVTKSPFTLPFQAAEQGKVCTLWARWVTIAGPGGKSQVGPWGSPLTFNVF